MSLKLLQTLVSTNEFFNKILLKRDYYRIISNGLWFKNYSLQHQIKFNLHDNLNIQQSYTSKQFSTSNNQYIPIILYDSTYLS